MADPNTPQSAPAAPAPQSPKDRFVRTLATDAAALKAGKLPGFTRSTQTAPGEPQLGETREDILARLKFEETGPSVDLGRQIQFDTSRFGIEVAPQTRPSERLVAPSPVPAPPPPSPRPAPVQPPVPQPAPQPAPSPLHTYQSDFGDEVKQTQASTATILAKQEDARPVTAVPSGKSGNLPWIIGGVALLVVGAGIAVAAYLFSSSPTVVSVLPQVPLRIFVDEQTKISGDGATLMSAIVDASTQELSGGSVRMVYTSTSTQNGSDVFSQLKLPAPDILLRNIISAGSIAGIVHSGASQNAFFLLAVSSYPDTFAGMLAWETHMQRDLAQLYPLYTASAPPPPPVVATSTKKSSKTKVATTTPTVYVPDNTPTGFVDKVVSNHDARVLKDLAGRSIMIYGYFDAKTLIIARDENAFNEIVSRLTTSRTQGT